MEVKFIEIRDNATCVRVVAFRTNGSDLMQEQFFFTEGFGPNSVILVRCECQEAHYDPYEWSRSARTMRIAHEFIIQHWDELNEYDLVDVQYILGEIPEKRKSETWWGIV